MQQVTHTKSMAVYIGVAPTFSHPYHGLVERRGFSIVPVHGMRNRFRPQFIGKVKAVEGGSQIEVFAETNGLQSVMLILGILGLLFAIGSWWFDSGEPVAGLAAATVGLLFFVLIRMNFKWSVEEEFPSLRKRLLGTPIGD